MAAQAWTFYNSFRRNLGQQLSAGAGLSAGIFRVSLHAPASNAATLTLTLKSEVTVELSTGNGYVAGGNTLCAQTWASVASGTYRFDGSDIFWSANGGAIPTAGSGARFAVVYESGGLLVCWTSLTSGNIATLADTNRLTIQLNASGVFEMA